MSECKVCKEQFHYCSSCSLDPEHPRTYGFCSWNCMMEDKDAEIASLKAENAELKKRLAKFEADRMPFEQQTCGRRK